MTFFPYIQDQFFLKFEVRQGAKNRQNAKPSTSQMRDSLEMFSMLYERNQLHIEGGDAF